ncbi:phosphatidylserine decarboxylase [Leeuwenhoekiella aestuarii]|uniref:Phosphatidylserine decarboxylase proenzyme n=1 Tax=Leeuwenhoekiella aestuarii TaxID=2249426 RepID=A0A4Q0NSR9_9FLAO|nr:phosphatidylserine decarboxylase family protein [Leeuwenhoekiella aestuarii]RXG13936.1 phosphatidylserine decarboxylase [Leeuwenhoekiella aestuarii]RXG18683.1 phosphatidylserine decarboxylase [Leeuwenhoekiella aestuarii]
MFHKEGYTIIIITLLIVAVGFIATQTWVSPVWLQYVCYGALAVLLILILQFFRNPTRTANGTIDEIIAPVDGKVVVIEEVYEREYFKENRLQVSIFMSPINVHVTRYPAAGEVVYSKYHPGKYLVAWHPKASEENERTTVVVRTTSFGDILYRQIAGAMAKRIVNYAKKGDNAVQGKDSGFIKFGSRVDLYLPVGTPIAVKLNQKVKGAESIIATLK